MFFSVSCSTNDGAGCLHAAVKNNLPAVVDLLCQKGAIVDKCDIRGDCTLWQAVSAEQFDMADILVSNSLLAIGQALFRVACLKFCANKTACQ
jgi:ankyrin repeat protein